MDNAGSIPQFMLSLVYNTEPFLLQSILPSRTHPPRLKLAPEGREGGPLVISANDGPEQHRHHKFLLVHNLTLTTQVGRTKIQLRSSDSTVDLLTCICQADALLPV